MQRYVIEDMRHVPPFNEPASLLTVGVRPLKIHHEELFAKRFRNGIQLGPPLKDRGDLPRIQGEALVYRDNLWFDEEFLDYFLKHAYASGQACRAAILADDPAYRAERRILRARHPVRRIVLTSDSHDDSATFFATQFAFGQIGEGPAQSERGDGCQQ